MPSDRLNAVYMGGVFRMTTVQIRPGVGLLSLFPAMNYRPWYALGEFVDNSIQSYLEHREELRALHGADFKLRIDISYVDSDNPEILVADNAAGIYESDIQRAFTPAMRPPDQSGISQYGIGMKSAATWYSNFYTINTTALGETVRRTVTFDIAKIVDNQIEQLPVEEVSEDANVHGTRIVMRDLHQGLPVGRTQGKINEYLSSIYRDFIKSGEVVMSVNGKELEFAHPPILEAPYWPNEKGPDPVSATRLWKIPIDITLDESWGQDRAPNKPEKPPRVRGWIAILKTGSTKKSGLALVWRRKVVVGAGSLAQGDEDSYRPARIFGTTNTFPFQRLFGELDVSELKVTTFKDQIDWRSGQQDELQDKIHRIIRDGQEPILRMANNFRSTVKTPDTKKTVEESAESVIEAAKSGYTGLWANSDELAQIPVVPDPVDTEVETSKSIVGVAGQDSLVFEVVTAPGDMWLRLTKADDCWIVRLNRSHPFMNSFANLPGADLDPVFRLAMAIALAQIRARQTNMLEYPDALFLFMNEYLTGDLATRRSSGE